MSCPAPTHPALAPGLDAAPPTAPTATAAEAPRKLPTQEELLLRRLHLVEELAHGVLVVAQDGTVIDVPTPNADTLFVRGDGRPAWRDARGKMQPVAVWDALHEPGSSVALMLQVNFEQLMEGLLPRDLCLEQMPRGVVRGGRRLRLQCRTVLDGEDVKELVITVTELAGQRDELRVHEENAEFRRITETLMKNIEASRAFFSETRWLMEKIEHETESAALMRHVHTIKGNLGVFGFEQLAKAAHLVEERIIEQRPQEAAQELATLREAWATREQTFGSIFAGRADQEIILSREEYEDMVMQLMCQADYTELLTMAQRWAMMPVSRVFSRMELQLERMASHLGKKVRCAITHNQVRLPATGMEALWASMIHLVRNALDHGFESPSERLAAGKPAEGTFALTACLTEDDAVLTIADDGRGVPWDKVRAKAAAAGLPCDSHDDLVRALLSDGMSTAEGVTELSGRGAGTSAVREAVEALGGRVAIDSTLGQGTTFTLTIPLAALATLGVLS